VPYGWQARVEIASRTARTCFPVDCRSVFAGQSPYWTDMLFGMSQPTAVPVYVQMPTGDVRKLEATPQADPGDGESGRQTPGGSGMIPAPPVGLRLTSATVRDGWALLPIGRDGGNRLSRPRCLGG
jgi:hypothetical protein